MNFFPHIIWISCASEYSSDTSNILPYNILSLAACKSRTIIHNIHRIVQFVAFLPSASNARSPLDRTIHGKERKKAKTISPSAVVWRIRYTETAQATGNLESRNFVAPGSQLWNKRFPFETVDVNSDFLAGCTQN